MDEEGNIVGHALACVLRARHADKCHRHVSAQDVPTACPSGSALVVEGVTVIRAAVGVGEVQPMILGRTLVPAHWAAAFLRCKSRVSELTVGVKTGHCEASVVKLFFGVHLNVGTDFSCKRWHTSRGYRAS